MRYPGYQRFFLAWDEELHRPKAEDTSGEAARKGFSRGSLYKIFSLVYPEEGSIAETSVKIPIITASVLQFLNLH